MRKTHGGSGAKIPEYPIWMAIKQRCVNPNDPAYHNYGGRNIKVCDCWLHSFENFIADMGRRPDNGYSIDRIDVNGNYSKENCVWIEHRKQFQNMRKNVIIEWNGEKHCLSEWGRILGIKISTLNSRYRSGRRPPGLFVKDDKRRKAQVELSGDKTYTGHKECKLILAPKAGI